MWAGITPLMPPQKHLYPRHTSFSGVTAVLRILKGKKKSINTIVKSKHPQKIPAAGDILSHKMHNRQCTCPLWVSSLSKAGKYKKYWIGRPNRNLELLLCTSSSRQMCTFCNCYQFWATRAEFLFTESICAIKFSACYDLYINTYNNTTITLHKYNFFWPQNCFAFVRLRILFVMFTVTEEFSGCLKHSWTSRNGCGP